VLLQHVPSSGTMTSPVHDLCKLRQRTNASLEIEIANLTQKHECRPFALDGNGHEMQSRHRHHQGITAKLDCSAFF